MIKFKKDDHTSVSAIESPTLFIRIFPNPVPDQVYIESNEPIHKIEVITTDGNVFLAEDFGGKRSCTLNVQPLNPGIYFVRITIQNRVYSRKIIKM